MRPNVGQVFHKIGRLYVKTGPNSQMNDVNNPSSSGCSVAMQLAAEDNVILPGPSNETMAPPLSVSLFEHFQSLKSQMGFHLLCGFLPVSALRVAGLKSKSPGFVS